MNVRLCPENIFLLEIGWKMEHLEQKIAEKMPRERNNRPSSPV